LAVVVNLERGRVKEFAVEMNQVCLLKPDAIAAAAYVRTLEVAIRKEALQLKGLTRLRLGVALWHGGLPIDVMPAEGFLEVALGEESAAWAVE
jgi:hypothetical protein